MAEESICDDDGLLSGWCASRDIRRRLAWSALVLCDMLSCSGCEADPGFRFLGGLLAMAALGVDWMPRPAQLLLLLLAWGPEPIMLETSRFMLPG